MVVCAGPHCLPAGGRQPACLALLKNTCAALRRRAVGLFNPSAGRGMQVQELARVQERDMAENIVYEFLPCDYDALVAQGRPTGATKSCTGVKAGTQCEKGISLKSGVKGWCWCYQTVHRGEPKQEFVKFFCTECFASFGL